MTPSRGQDRTYKQSEKNAICSENKHTSFVMVHVLCRYCSTERGLSEGLKKSNKNEKSIINTRRVMRERPTISTNDESAISRERVIILNDDDDDDVLDTVRQ